MMSAKRNTSKRLTVETTNALEASVLLWINERAAEYGDGSEVTPVLRDLFRGGCASGIVHSLISTANAAFYYRRHNVAINALVAEAGENCGKWHGAMLDGWDQADPLALEDHNQGLLAWFGFEEAARQLADRAGLDV